MTFAFWPALLAGLTGTIAMTALMRMSIAVDMTNMPPMPLIQGAMATDDPQRAKMIGLVTHVLVMGMVVFGIIYAAIFAALGTAGWVTGAIIGAIHGVVAGVFLKMMGQTHPRMEPAANFTGDATWTTDAQGLHIEEPGLFGKNWGAATPMGLLVGHTLFGLVVGAVYAALV
jgi:hypothetical protein